MTDSLTSLPQRPAVHGWVGEALAAQSGERVALTVVNVDGFSVVIESLGMRAADEVLRIIAGRLQEAGAAAGAPVARAGGDEFAVVLPGVRDEADAEERIVELVQATFGQPLEVDGHALFLTASTGVAVSPPDDSDELLRRATVAVAAAKRVGGGRTERFRPRPSVTLGNLGLYAELREAVQRAQLVAHYQPIVDLDATTVIGVEALLRWTHPDRGVLGPPDFLPPIADSVLIEDLGLRILRQACRDAVELMARHPKLSYVSVNVAPRQLTSQRYAEQVLDAIEDAQLPPDHLVIEITEIALVDDLNAARDALRLLRDKGVCVALDDFGTGYATMTSLRQLPIDKLKIDQTFIAGLGMSERDATIVESVILLARSIGIDAIAEGVESRAQEDALRALGCRLAQGHRWSPAVPAADLEETITRIEQGGRRRRQPKHDPLRGGPLETRRIIELHHDGASAQTIAAALNRAGLVTNTGGRWHATQVLRILDAMMAEDAGEPAR